MTKDECWSEFWSKIATIYAGLDHEQPNSLPAAA